MQPTNARAMPPSQLTRAYMAGVTGFGFSRLQSVSMGLDVYHLGP